MKVEFIEEALEETKKEILDTIGSRGELNDSEMNLAKNTIEDVCKMYNKKLKWKLWNEECKEKEKEQE